MNKTLVAFTIMYSIVIGMVIGWFCSVRYYASYKYRHAEYSESTFGNSPDWIRENAKKFKWSKSECYQDKSNVVVGHVSNLNQFGNMSSEGELKKDEDGSYFREGTWVFYDDSGQFAKVTQFNNGIPWYTLDMQVDGSIKTYRYENGVLKKTEAFFTEAEFDPNQSVKPSP